MLDAYGNDLDALIRELETPISAISRPPDPCPFCGGPKPLRALECRTCYYARRYRARKRNAASKSPAEKERQKHARALAMRGESCR